MAPRKSSGSSRTKEHFLNEFDQYMDDMKRGTATAKIPLSLSELKWLDDERFQLLCEGFSSIKNFQISLEDNFDENNLEHIARFQQLCIAIANSNQSQISLARCTIKSEFLFQYLCAAIRQSKNLTIGMPIDFNYLTEKHILDLSKAIIQSTNSSIYFQTQFYHLNQKLFEVLCQIIKQSNNLAISFKPDDSFSIKGSDYLQKFNERSKVLLSIIPTSAIYSIVTCHADLDKDLKLSLNKRKFSILKGLAASQLPHDIIFEITQYIGFKPGISALNTLRAEAQILNCSDSVIKSLLNFNKKEEVYRRSIEKIITQANLPENKKAQLYSSAAKTPFITDVEKKVVGINRYTRKYVFFNPPLQVRADFEKKAQDIICKPR